MQTVQIGIKHLPPPLTGFQLTSMASCNPRVNKPCVCTSPLENGSKLMPRLVPQPSETFPVSKQFPTFPSGLSTHHSLNHLHPPVARQAWICPSHCPYKRPCRGRPPEDSARLQIHRKEWSHAQQDGAAQRCHQRTFHQQDELPDPAASQPQALSP